MTVTLKELRAARGLPQSRMGISQDVASELETGKRLPGVNALNKIVAALNAADSAHPTSPVEVMAACRESQRRAGKLVARERQARNRKPVKSKRVVGQVVAHDSCVESTGSTNRRAGRPSK